MAMIPQNPALQIIGIGAALQHPHVVVGFQQQSVQIPQMVDDILVVMSHIRRHRHGPLPALHPVGHRIGRVVVDAEGLNRQISHHKVHVRAHGV